MAVEPADDDGVKSPIPATYVDEVKEMQIMITAYGFVVNLIMTNKGWCPSVRDFPYALPEPKSLSIQAKVLVEKEIELITKAKWEEPTDKEKESGKNMTDRLSQGSSDGNPSGAPPSADNNV